MRDVTRTLGAVLITAALGGVVALFISHRQGIYYALLTIAFCQVFWFVANKWHTGGEDGLLNIRRLSADFGLVSIPLLSNDALYFFCQAVFAVVAFSLWRLIHSPPGRIFGAITGFELPSENK